jgi:hypothetical protein
VHVPALLVVDEHFVEDGETAEYVASLMPVAQVTRTAGLGAD